MIREIPNSQNKGIYNYSEQEESREIEDDHLEEENYYSMLNLSKDVK